MPCQAPPAVSPAALYASSTVSAMAANGGRTAWGSLAARLRGEVDAAVLEAFRRAGSAVYDLADHAEEMRLRCNVDECSPWEADPGVQAQLLCSWNAFVLQMLGDRLLLADYESDPRSEGLVPPVTLQQAERFYAEVHRWMVAARLAAANREFRLAGPLPAEMPTWLPVERPRNHLIVMHSVALELCARTDLALRAFPPDDPREDHQITTTRMRELLAEALARIEFAGSMLADLPVELLPRTDLELQKAMRSLYRLGQYEAMPFLLRNEELRRRGRRPLRARSEDDAL